MKQMIPLSLAQKHLIRNEIYFQFSAFFIYSLETNLN